MAFTRYNYDDSRKKKITRINRSRRYIMNVPGNGSNPCFFNDPQIRIKMGCQLTFSY